MTLELVSIDEVRVSAKARAQTCQHTLLIHGKRVPFETVNEASGIVCKLRDQSDMGASQFGSQFPIVDKTGAVVGYVSYNGKVWQGRPEDWQNATCVFNPYKEPCAV